MNMHSMMGARLTGEKKLCDDEIEEFLEELPDVSPLTLFLCCLLRRSTQPPPPPPPSLPLSKLVLF